MSEHPAAEAIRFRIAYSYPSLMQEYGVEAVLRAVEEVTEGIGPVEEIGTSDVSIWTEQVRRNLEGDQIRKQERLFAAANHRKAG